MKRLELRSKCALYQAEFQSQQKWPGEDWPSFGIDLKFIVIKVFPNLNEAAEEQLAVYNYPSQLDPQLGFSVHQHKPKTIAKAVATTLEMAGFSLGLFSVVLRHATFPQLHSSSGLCWCILFIFGLYKYEVDTPTT